LMLVSAPLCWAQESETFSPDPALCEKMLRFGKEAYQRGKYLDAKEYFRKAIKADPTSMEAWVFYDQSVIFGLAEKVEKKADLVLPDTSIRKEASTDAPPSPEPESEKEEIEFKIVEDEGC
ncbi:MAG: tetratricopeptide repeat protein, partial [Desulfatiglandaceae bacterium]